MKKSARKIICADAVKWMRKHDNLGTIITSLPDKEEVSMDEADYVRWFHNAALQCFKSATQGRPVIFYQTDRLYKGQRISKAQMLFKAASEADMAVVWHKIALRRGVGKIDLRRPGYTHLICFGDEEVKAGKATPDVFEAGGMLYPNGTGTTAAMVALNYAIKYGPDMCDPFCGRGTIPILAEQAGFTKIIGVDIDEEQCEAARTGSIGNTNVARGSTVKRNRLFS